MVKEVFNRIFRYFFVLLLIFPEIKSLAQEQILNFEDALQIAREHSPDIQQARLSLNRSQKLLEAENASLKSRFTLDLQPFNYYHNREFNQFFSTWNTSELKQSSLLFTISQPILLTDGVLALRNEASWQDAYSEFQGDRTQSFSNNLYLSFDQPLFTYNRQSLALEEVRLDKENALINYRIQELLLERRVAQSFYRAYQSKMSLTVASEEYQNRLESFRIIKNKVDAGLVAREELLQAELDMTSSNAEVKNQEVSLANALDDLKNLIGISLFDEIGIVADITMDSVAVDLKKALDYGLEHRLELRESKIGIELSRASLVQSTAVNEFRGDLSLSYGIIGTDPNFNQIYQVPTQNQRVNLSVQIPLWDWGERASRIEAAQVNVEKSNLSYDQERNGIIIAIRQVYRSLQNQIVQVDLQKQNVRTAQLTYDINLERYRNGDLTSMDLNLFQNQLSQRKIGLVNAMISYKMDLIDLKIESLWDFEHNRPVVFPVEEGDE